MMKINKIFYTLFFCLFAFKVWAAEVNISLDKKVMSEGDTLFLTITYNGSDNNSPDFSHLTKDFSIVSNSTSQSINFINGVVNQIKQWKIGLIPLKTGKINISPIKMGNLISNDAEVEVREVSDVAYAPDNRENSNSPYFQIKQTADVSSPYLQQQVTFFINIYDSIGLQNAVINVSDETLKDWVIIPLLSKPIVRQDVINNKQMNIETYAFAAFPQKSGVIKTPQFVFDGYYIRNTDFDLPNFNDDLMMFGVNFRNAFGQRVPVKMKTKAEDITVKPVPANINKATWLPLNGLNLSASWPEKAKFKVGEAISRTITIQATGITESMLPQIAFPDADGFKQYPEKPETSEQIVHGKLVTTAKINNVYIPVRSGELTIPALKIQWFNVDSNKIETAVIPEETISIQPGDSDNINDTPSAKEKNFTNEDTNASKPVQTDTPKKEEMPLDFSWKEIINNPLFAGLLIVFLCILIFLFILFSKKGKNQQRHLVIHSLKKHDYKAAKDALLLWGQEKFPQSDIPNFNTLSHLINDDDFSKQLSELNRILYSGSFEFFDDTKFIETFKKVDKMKKKEYKNNDVLPNLYD